VRNIIFLLLFIPTFLLAQGPGPCVPTLININLDQYPSETTWDIQDTLGNVIISGGPYTNVPNYQPQFIVNCLPPGELSFTIYDLYGDGLEGSVWGGQDGSYYLMQCGDTVVLVTILLLVMIVRMYSFLLFAHHHHQYLVV